MKRFILTIFIIAFSVSQIFAVDLGDYADAAQTIRFDWTTNDSNGEAITRSTDGTISVYRDDETTQTTTGVTDSEDFDSITGNHHCSIDFSTSSTFYTAGHDYQVKLTGAVVDTRSVTAVLAHFSIQNRFMRGTDSAATASALSTHDADITSRTIPSADYFDPVTDVVTSITATINAQIALDRNMALIESQRGAHTAQGEVFYVDPVNGDTHANGNRGRRFDPYDSVQDCHDNAVVDSNHDVIILVSGAAAGATTLIEDVTLSKRYLFIRGPGRDFIWTRSGNGDTITVTGDGLELSGFQLETAATGGGHGIQATDSDFLRVHRVWINDTRGDGINIVRGDNAQLCHNVFQGSGQTGVGQGIHISGVAGTSNENVICNNVFSDVQGDAILVEQGTTHHTHIYDNQIHTSTAWGINIGASSEDALVHDNVLFGNSSGPISDAGSASGIINNYDIVDGVLDEVITSADHNVKNSLARRIREIGAGVSATGDVVSATTNTLTLDADASDNDGSYDPSIVIVTDNADPPNIQHRSTLEYFGSGGGNGNPGRTLVLDRDWKTIPDNTYTFTIEAGGQSISTNEGQVRAGSLTSAKLNPLAPTEVSLVGQIIQFRSGNNSQDQPRIITGYSTATQTVFFSALNRAPDITTGYMIYPFGMVSIEALQGNTQSAINLKALVDSWYNPATNKGQGVVLVDTTTTNTDMVDEAPTALQNAITLLAQTITALGVSTIKDMLNVSYAVDRGKMTISGDYTSQTVSIFDDDDSTSLTKFTTTPTGRTPN